MVNLILGLLAAFASGAAHQDAPLDAAALQRVERMKTVFHTLGVRGPLELKSFLRGGFLGGSQVVLTDRNNATYTAQIGTWVDGTQRISIDRPKEYELDGMYPRKDFHDRKLENQARVWATHLAPHKELRYEGLMSEHNMKLASASFTFTKNGIPIYGGQLGGGCGYLFTFTVPDGRFVAMEAYENPPPLDPHPPVLNEADAIATAQKILNSRFRDPNGDYKMTGHDLLFYWRSPGASLARPSWTLRFKEPAPPPAPPPSNPKTYGGSFVVAGDHSITLDAITGQLQSARDGFGKPMRPTATP